MALPLVFWDPRSFCRVFVVLLWFFVVWVDVTGLCDRHESAGQVEHQCVKLPVQMRTLQILMASKIHREKRTWYLKNGFAKTCVRLVIVRSVTTDAATWQATSVEPVDVPDGKPW